MLWVRPPDPDSEIEIVVSEGKRPQLATLKFEKSLSVIWQALPLPLIRVVKSARLPEIEVEFGPQDPISWACDGRPKAQARSPQDPAVSRLREKSFMEWIVEHNPRNLSKSE
jgi:hypothetical protein